DSALAVGDGLIEVTPTRVSVLTDMAIRAENIDEAKVEEARQRAAARLQEKISDEEVATVNASMVRALAQLQVKRRQRPRCQSVPVENGKGDSPLFPGDSYA